MWNLVAIFGNGTCALFVDRVGRRTFLLVGIAGCLVFLAIETAMVAKYVGTDNKAGNAAGGKLSLFTSQGQLWLIVSVCQQSLHSSDISSFTVEDAMSFNTYMRQKSSPCYGAPSEWVSRYLDNG